MAFDVTFENRDLFQVTLQDQGDSITIDFTDDSFQVAFADDSFTVDLSGQGTQGPPGPQGDSFELRAYYTTFNMEDSMNNVLDPGTPAAPMNGAVWVLNDATDAVYVALQEVAVSVDGMETPSTVYDVFRVQPTPTELETIIDNAVETYLLANPQDFGGTAWDNTHTYDVGDLVLYTSAGVSLTYISLVANNLGNVPIAEPTALTPDNFWARLTPYGYQPNVWNAANTRSIANEDSIDTIESELGLPTDAADADGTAFARIAQNVADIDALETTVGEHTMEINANTSGLAAQVLRIDAVTTTANQNETDITTLEGEVGASTDTADATGTLYARVAQNVEDINNLDTTQNTQDGLIAANTSAITALDMAKADQADLDDAVMDIATNTTGVATNLASINTLRNTQPDRLDYNAASGLLRLHLHDDTFTTGVTIVSGGGSGTHHASAEFSHGVSPSANITAPANNVILTITSQVVSSDGSSRFSVQGIQNITVRNGVTVEDTDTTDGVFTIQVPDAVEGSFDVSWQLLYNDGTELQAPRDFRQRINVRTPWYATVSATAPNVAADFGANGNQGAFLNGDRVTLTTTTAEPNFYIGVPESAVPALRIMTGLVFASTTDQGTTFMVGTIPYEVVQLEVGSDPGTLTFEITAGAN